MRISIQQAIDTIIAEIPGAPFGETVDLVKAGDPSQELKGAALTFMATSQVIEKTIELGANLLITHEPTFYNHLDIDRMAAKSRDLPDEAGDDRSERAGDLAIP